MSEQLSSVNIEEAAKLLTEARRAVRQIDGLGHLAPTDLPSAHLIADAHAEQLGWSVAGWKVGCTSAEARAILNCRKPFPGRVFDDAVHGSGILHHDAMHEPLLESEFAFELAVDLPPRNSLYSIAEVREATATIMPAIELVTSRYTDWLSVGHLSLIADSGSNGGVAFGPPVPVAECGSLRDTGVELTIDGTSIATGSGKGIMGDPWLSLQWLANDLSERKIGLSAGDFVLSGTCTGAHSFPAGSTATATFAGLGEVSIARTAP